MSLQTLSNHIFDCFKNHVHHEIWKETKNCKLGPILQQHHDKWIEMLNAQRNGINWKSYVNHGNSRQCAMQRKERHLHVSLWSEHLTWIVAWQPLPSFIRYEDQIDGTMRYCCQVIFKDNTGEIPVTLFTAAAQTILMVPAAHFASLEQSDNTAKLNEIMAAVNQTTLYTVLVKFEKNDYTNGMFQVKGVKLTVKKAPSASHSPSGAEHSPTLWILLTYKP